MMSAKSYSDFSRLGTLNSIVKPTINDERTFEFGVTLVDQRFGCTTIFVVFLYSLNENIKFPMTTENPQRFVNCAIK